MYIYFSYMNIPTNSKCHTIWHSWFALNRCTEQRSYFLWILHVFEHRCHFCQNVHSPHITISAIRSHINFLLRFYAAASRIRKRERERRYDYLPMKNKRLSTCRQLFPFFISHTKMHFVWEIIKYIHVYWNGRWIFHRAPNDQKNSLIVAPSSKILEPECALRLHWNEKSHLGCHRCRLVHPKSPYRKFFFFFWNANIVYK